MAKRFIFRSPPGQTSAIADKITARKFAEPSREQIEKAKKTWKRLAPKEAREMLK